jgi:alpha-1,2-mannosyltransferase
MTRLQLRAACLAAILALLLLHGWDLSAPGLLDRTGRMKCPDFLQFYTYGALARTGHAASLYDGGAHARIAQVAVDARVALTGLRPNYSPIVAWVMAPISSLGYLRAMGLWAALSAELCLVSVLLLLQMTPQLRRDKPTIALLMLAWPAWYVLLRYGQMSAVSLLLVAAATRLMSASRAFAAGVVFGCLVYKPNLIVLPGLVGFVGGEWMFLIGLVVGAGAEMLIAAGSVGLPVFEQYVGALGQMARHPDLVQMFPAESHSLAGAIRLFVPPLTQVTAISLLATGVCAWMVTRIWRTTPDQRCRWSALVVGTLLSTPHLLTYDLVLLAVPMLLTTDWRIESTGRPPAGAWMAALVLIYAGAWPGTLIARVCGVQISTIGMGLGLALLFKESKHQLVRRQAENDVIDRAAT